MVEYELPIRTLWLQKFIRPLLRFILFVQRKFMGQTVEIIRRHDGKTNGKKVVFAVTHIGKKDFEIVSEHMREHFYVMAADFMNTYGNINGWFMEINGVLWVNERSREDKYYSKKRAIQILKQDNLMVFPEGTWNLSENQIIYELAFGTVECAMQSGALICPIAVEQYGKHFVINEGEYIEPEKFQTKEEVNQNLRDAMATLKWEIWERHGIEKRNAVSSNYWEKFVAERMGEWSVYSMDEQIVNRYIPEWKREKETERIRCLAKQLEKRFSL